MDPIVIRHLVLHAGSAKTGTSSIQNALFRARDSLMEQGFLYPLAGVPLDGSVAHGHHDIARRIDPTQPVPSDTLRPIMEALRHEVATHPGHSVILSSEEFFGEDRMQVFTRLIAPERLTIHVSLRPQHEFLNANYYTEVSHNHMADHPDAYYDRAIPEVRYLQKLQTLAALCHRTDIRLRLFEKGSPARTAPVADFAATLGLRLPPEVMADNAVEHPTLPAQPTLFLRWLNEAGLDAQRFFEVFEALHRMRARLPGQMYTLSPARIEAVTRQFDAENREIRRLFLDGADAPLFQPPEIPDPVRWKAEVGKERGEAERDFLVMLCNLAATAS